MDLDRQIFYLINGTTHFPWLDFLMLFISQTVVPLAALFFLILFIQALRGKKDFRETVFLFATFSLGYLFNSYFLKNAFGRLRPSSSLVDTVLVGRPEMDFSFPSGHSFIIALLCVLVARKKDSLMIFFIPLTLLVGVSRIYLGAHFPSDVLVGLGLGFIYGLFINSVIDKFIEHKIFKILKFHLE